MSTQGFYQRQPSSAAVRPLPSNNQTPSAISRPPQRGMNSGQPFAYQGSFGGGAVGGLRGMVQPGTSSLQSGGWFQQMPQQSMMNHMQPSQLQQAVAMEGAPSYWARQQARFGLGRSGLRNQGTTYFDKQQFSYNRVQNDPYWAFRHQNRLPV